MSAVRLLALLFVCVVVASAAVHKIQTKHHALPSSHPKHFLGRASLRHQELYRRRVGMQASVGKLPIQHVNYLTTGVISVGTPAQSFNMEVDAFYENELIVIDSNANLSLVSNDIPPKNTYNAVQSSTYVAVNGNVSKWGLKAHKASDVLTIGSVSATVKSFLVADKVPYWLNYYPIDGLVGVAPTKKSWYNVSLIADDIVGQLDKPVVSVYVNATVVGNGTGQVTLGEEDLDNCQSTWAYVPSLPYYSNQPYTIHASSAEVTLGGQVTTLNLDANLTFMTWPSFDVPVSAMAVFVNGTGASWNETIGNYVINCDTTKAPQITLNIGGVGNDTDSTSQKLVLTGADYIRYWKSMDTCYLGVNFYGNRGFWYLGSQVLNNHCISFNYKDRTVGFADSKTPKTDVTTY